jgi:hypothetical protein
MSKIIEEVKVQEGYVPEFEVYDLGVLKLALEEAGFAFEQHVSPAGRKGPGASIYVKGEFHPIGTYSEFGMFKRLMFGNMQMPGFSVYHTLLREVIQSLS